MNYQELKPLIFEKIGEYHNTFAEMNDWIACHPEVSSHEVETAALIVRTLEEQGFVCETEFDGIPNAFRAVCGPNDHKYKVAVLAEFDALPGLGHACGHCLSGSISCLAAAALKDLQDELDTDIHVIGTPAEETLGRKCDMTDHGVFDQYDMAIMVHLYNYNLVFPHLLALAAYFYEFHGKAAHSAAAPWDGVNAFNAAQLQFHGLDMLRQHLTPDARLHGIIRDGGKAPNIVPDYVRSEIYARAARRDYRNEIVAQMDKMAEGACMMTGCTWNKYQEDHDFDDLKFNRTGDTSLREIFDELGLELPENEDFLFGSSDIGNVSYACPAFHPCVQISAPEVNIHTPEFAALMTTDLAHDRLDVGAKVIAMHIANIFSDPEKIAAMKADFEKN